MNNATVGNQSAHSIQSQAGVELSLRFNAGEIGLRPHVQAAWLHEFANEARTMNAALGGVDFAIKTRDPQRNSARLSAGLNAQVSSRTTLYVDLTAQPGGPHPGAQRMARWRLNRLLSPITRAVPKHRHRSSKFKCRGAA